MNAFEKIIQAVGLNTDSQHEQGWLYSLLTYASTDYEGGDTYTNPVREAIRRLEARGVGPHTLVRVHKC